VPAIRAGSLILVSGGDAFGPDTADPASVEYGRASVTAEGIEALTGELLTAAPEQEIVDSGGIRNLKPHPSGNRK
jgi:hypothetical protein